MKIIKYILIPLSIIILLSGCAAGGKKYSSQEEISNFKDNLYIYRPDKTFGSAIQPTVYVDGKYLGSLENAGFIKYSTKAGEHTLKVGNKEVKYTTNDNEKKYFKYNVRTSLFFFITISAEKLVESDKELALKDLTETKQSTHRVDN